MKQKGVAADMLAAMILEICEISDAYTRRQPGETGGGDERPEARCANEKIIDKHGHHRPTVRSSPVYEGGSIFGVPDKRAEVSSNHPHNFRCSSPFLCGSRSQSFHQQRRQGLVSCVGAGVWNTTHEQLLFDSPD